MDVAGLAVFATAYALLVVTPGPAIASLVAHVLGGGIRVAPPIVASFLVGDLFWYTVAALGLAAVAQTHAGIFEAVKWAGVAYLLYFAWTMWRTPASPVHAEANASAVPPARLFISGFMLTLGNPKAIAFFLALLPAIVDLDHMSAMRFLEGALLIAVIQPTLTAGYVFAAHGLRGLFRSPKALRKLNRFSAAAIAGAAVAIAARS